MEIKRETDYSKFKRHPEQRPVEPRPRLIRSMEAHGFIKAYHITINEKWEIVDGQHRFETAKKLGLPIFYVVQDIPIEQVQEAGGTAKVWTAKDYLESYIQQGKESYVRLGDFLEKRDRGLQQILRIMSITAIKMDKFKRGEFVFDNDDERLVSDTLELLKEVSEYAAEVSSSAYFLSAIVNMLKTKGFDKRRLLEKLEYQTARVRKQADPNGYLRMLEDIYNYKADQKNRLYFKGGGYTALRERFPPDGK